MAEEDDFSSRIRNLKDKLPYLSNEQADGSIDGSDYEELVGLSQDDIEEGGRMQLWMQGNEEFEVDEDCPDPDCDGTIHNDLIEYSKASGKAEQAGASQSHGLSAGFYSLEGTLNVTGEKSEEDGLSFSRRVMSCDGSPYIDPETGEEQICDYNLSDKFRVASAEYDRRVVNGSRDPVERAQKESDIDSWGEEKQLTEDVEELDGDDPVTASNEDPSAVEGEPEPRASDTDARETLDGVGSSTHGKVDESTDDKKNVNADKVPGADSERESVDEVLDTSEGNLQNDEVSTDKDTPSTESKGPEP